MIKYTIFNITTAIVGISAMFNYVMKDVYAAELGTLVLIWLGTFAVSLFGTMAIAEIETRIQNRREKAYALWLKKAYGMGKR